MAGSIRRILAALGLLGVMAGSCFYCVKESGRAMVNHPALAQTAPAMPAARGKLKVNRVWDDGDYTYVLVAYENDTASTFRNAVTIECEALNKKDEPVNQNERSFFVHERGPVGPGFKGTLKVPIERHGARVASASCKIIKAI